MFQHLNYARYIWLNLHFEFTVRAKRTLAVMGPAVWNGSFSTFLSIAMFSATDSYSYLIFFKVNQTFLKINIQNLTWCNVVNFFKKIFKLFFGVVLFGLFHGLVYLPVILSLFGSEYAAHTDSNDTVQTLSIVTLKAMDNVAFNGDDHGQVVL